MSRVREETNRAMLRVRDAIDRDCAQPLDVRTLAASAVVGEPVGVPAPRTAAAGARLLHHRLDQAQQLR